MSAPVTSETLTAEMIRDARAAFRDEIERLIGVVHDCSDQLVFQKRQDAGLPHPSTSIGARQRICDAINARRGKES